MSSGFSPFGAKVSGAVCFPAAQRFDAEKPKHFKPSHYKKRKKETISVPSFLKF